MAQIPIPNKYFECGYKDLVFCKNNGWIMENCTKMSADSSAENTPKISVQVWDTWKKSPLWVSVVGGSTY